MTMREATGGCHCGKVHFRVRFADPPELLDCNCSICAKTGFLHLIVDKAGFTLERGADALTDYRWGSGTARHLFCSSCGIKSFYVPRSHPDGCPLLAPPARCEARKRAVRALRRGRSWLNVAFSLRRWC